MSPSRIVLASANRGKLAEIEQLLRPHGLHPVSQSELGIDSPVEDGLSFVENALIKARHAAHAAGLPAIADDSGLAVDALHGAPGIHSARYAGVQGDGADEANNIRLLDALAEVPEARRSARYHCVMVYMCHAEDPTPLICQGSWEGRIATAPAGDGGFGYDPLFLVPEESGPDGAPVTAAQLAPEHKNRISHRGRALRALIRALGHDPDSDRR